MEHTTITPEQAADRHAIRELVDRFYAKIRRDPVLGPIFDRAIGAERRMLSGSVRITTRRGSSNQTWRHLGCARM